MHLLTIKGFHEASAAMARRRIAALEPDGYTRVGAAIRHATALLGRERAVVVALLAWLVVLGVAPGVLVNPLAALLP